MAMLASRIRAYRENLRNRALDGFIFLPPQLRCSNLAALQSPLRPLQVFAQQYSSRIERDAHPKADYDVIQRFIRMFPSVKSILLMSVDGFFAREEDLFTLFRTTFGLRVDIPTNTTHRSRGVVSVRTDSRPISEKDNMSEKKEGHRYRLLPSWQKSYLWYDTESSIYSKELENNPGEYEEAFVKQDIHQGSRSLVFPDRAVRVGWEVGGYLIACWLVLQDDVESVEYNLSEKEKKYNINKRNLEGMLQEFLEYENALFELEWTS